MIKSFVGYVNEFNNSLNANGPAFQHDIVSIFEAMAKEGDEDNALKINNAMKSMKQIHKATESFKPGTVLGQNEP